MPSLYASSHFGRMIEVDFISQIPPEWTLRICASASTGSVRIVIVIPEKRNFSCTEKIRMRAEDDIQKRRATSTITGYVDDIRPYIAGATVYVAPLRVGGGTRLKLMEAMAMAKAIVSTGVGAEGFPVVSGQELILANEPERFAQEVLKLLDNPIRRAELGQAGQAFAQANYGWDALVPRFEQICQPGDVLSQ